jgi:lysophospholipase L1-like esterase
MGSRKLRAILDITLNFILYRTREPIMTHGSTTSNLKRISNKLLTVLFIASLILLLISVAFNLYLFDFGKQYYLQLNSTRLDPLGLHYFPDTLEQSTETDLNRVHVVFFGDSRAAEWPAPVIEGFTFWNRGIGAQTSAQVSQRYDKHIKPLNADILVLQVCINDLKTIPLFPEWKSAIIARCKDNIQQILQQARTQEMDVVLSTVFPVGQVPLERRLFWSDEVATAIEDVNTFIKSLDGEQTIVFDAFDMLADENGNLREEYSRDELHLNSAGYEVLNQAFVGFIQSLDQ